jgi:hypothetical protein
MTTALIGYTGFVGSNVLSQRAFDDLYRSTNISQIADKHYELVVSAGNRADSFRINEHPDQDLREIEDFVRTMSSATIDKLVLISTVCVHAASQGLDDSPDEEAPIVIDRITPYGRNRYFLERALSEQFDTLVLRLPQLYGPRMKKGLLFDLIHRRRLEHIAPDDAFQYYDVGRLWSDIEVALDADLVRLNMATPPLGHRTLARDLFGIHLDDFDHEPQSPFASMYTRNMTTRHARLFGRDGHYLIDEDESLVAIRRFLAHFERQPVTAA